MKIIIANTDVGALLKSADSILSRYSKDTVPENIKGQAVLSVLKNMTQNKNHFSVCDVDKLAKMNEVVISEEHQELFNSLHCVDWNEMHADTREYLVATLVDYFRGNIVMANVK